VKAKDFLFNRRSFATKFALVMFLVIFAGQLIGGIWYIQQAKIHLEQDLTERIDLIGAILAQAGKAPLSRHEYTSLQPLLDETARDENIVAARIVNSENTQLAEIVHRKSETAGSDQWILFPEFRQKSFPINTDTQKLGSVEITFSSKRINRTLLSLIISTILFLTLLLLLVLYIAYKLFLSKIAAPIEKLNHAIEKVSKRDLTVSFKTDRQDEIGSLIRLFSYLVETLKTNIGKLSSMAVNINTALKQMEHICHKGGEATDSQLASVERMGQMIYSMEDSQKEVFNSAENLSVLFQDDVSSILEIRASIAEIVSSMDKLFQSTAGAYAVVSDVSDSSTQIGAGADMLSGLLNETSASVEEIFHSIKLVEDNARQSAEVAASVSMTTNKVGMQAVRKARNGMLKIQDEVSTSSDIIMKLGNRSKDIEKILHVIKDVTEQTNLLSLNAAILAEKAGEYGKAFGVVADEIGNLAERTAMSTFEISNIVGTIQKEISDAVESTTSAMQRVDEGVTLVGSVEDALNQTLEGSEKASEMACSIEKATLEQGKSIRHIFKAMDHIRAMNRQLNLALKQQETGMDELVDIVGTVRDVAGEVNRGLDEQNSGVQMISDNLEKTNEKISLITEATFIQKQETESLAKLTDNIRSSSKASLSIIKEMRNTLTTLNSKTEAMRKEVEGFKLK